MLDALRPARRNGARTIAVTNHIGSPIAAVAAGVPCSTARGSPALGENAAARVAQRDDGMAERNLSRTREAVRNKRRG